MSKIIGLTKLVPFQPIKDTAGRHLLVTENWYPHHPNTQHPNLSLPVSRMMRNTCLLFKPLNAGHVVRVARAKIHVFRHDQRFLLSTEACPHSPSYSESQEGQVEGAPWGLGVGEQPELHNMSSLNHPPAHGCLCTWRPAQGENKKRRRTCKTWQEIKFLASRSRKEKKKSSHGYFKI